MVCINKDNKQFTRRNSCAVEIDNGFDVECAEIEPRLRVRPKAVKLNLERFPQGRFHPVIHLLKTRLFAFYVNRLRGVYDGRRERRAARERQLTARNSPDIAATLCRLRPRTHK